MKHLIDYKIFESNFNEDIIKDLENIFRDIVENNEEYRWHYYVATEDGKFSVYLEFGDDNDPEYENDEYDENHISEIIIECIKSSIDHMNIYDYEYKMYWITEIETHDKIYDKKRKIKISNLKVGDSIYGNEGILINFIKKLKDN